MGVFDHNGLRKSTGVRPVRDDLKEAGLAIPDTSNFESREPEVEVEDVSMVNSVPAFNVEPTGVFDAQELMEEGKGLKIGNEVKKSTGLKVRPANVSRETKVANEDPYLHDLDNESQYARSHPRDYDVNSPDFAIMDARAQLLNMDIDRGVKNFLLAKLNEYSHLDKTSQASSGSDTVSWRSQKEAKLSDEEKKKVSDYWMELYPGKYPKEMVDDNEVKCEGKGKNRKK